VTDHLQTDTGNGQTSAGAYAVRGAPPATCPSHTQPLSEMCACRTSGSHEDDHIAWSNPPWLACAFGLVWFAVA
jgi:hypothetical protein